MSRGHGIKRKEERISLPSKIWATRVVKDHPQSEAAHLAENRNFACHLRVSSIDGCPPRLENALSTQYKIHTVASYGKKLVATRHHHVYQHTDVERW